MQDIGVAMAIGSPGLAETSRQVGGMSRDDLLEHWDVAEMRN